MLQEIQHCASQVVEATHRPIQLQHIIHYSVLASVMQVFIEFEKLPVPLAICDIVGSDRSGERKIYLSSYGEQGAGSYPWWWIGIYNELKSTCWVLRTWTNFLLFCIQSALTLSHSSCRTDSCAGASPFRTCALTWNCIFFCLGESWSSQATTLSASGCGL